MINSGVELVRYSSIWKRIDRLLEILTSVQFPRMVRCTRSSTSWPRWRPLSRRNRRRSWQNWSLRSKFRSVWMRRIGWQIRFTYRRCVYWMSRIIRSYSSGWTLFRTVRVIRIDGGCNSDDRRFNRWRRRGFRLWPVFSIYRCEIRIRGWIRRIWPSVKFASVSVTPTMVQLAIWILDEVATWIHFRHRIISK